MSGNDPPPLTPLQFDTAEYSDPQMAASVCSVCNQPIAQTYYTVNTAIICEQCHGKIEAFPGGGSRLRRAFTAAVLGLLAGLAGAAIWYAVRRITGYEIGLIAIVVGLMVGIAVRRGSRGRGGWFYQGLAIVLTYGCISAQYVPDVVEAILQESRKAPSAPAQPAGGPPAGKFADKSRGENVPAEMAAPADGAAPKHGIARAALGVVILLAVAFILSLAVPFFGGAENIIGLLIIGFALYEAWKINKRLPVQVAGPFQLSPSSGPGTAGL